MRLVLVEWADSHFTTDGWHGSNMEVDKGLCVTIGLLTLDDGEYIVVSPDMTHSMHGDLRYAQDTTIPKSAIKRIRQLKLSQG